MPKRLFDEQYYAVLAKRIREADQDAFAELYANTWQDMARYAQYILKNPDLVPDVLQESYIAVYKNIGKLRLDTLLLPWMRQIVYHQCIDAVRRDRARHEVPGLNDPDGRMLDVLVQKSANGAGAEAYRAAYGRELRPHIRAALKALPVRERQAFVLRYEYDLQLEQIADFLDCSTATVKRSITAARTALQKELANLREYV